MQPKVLLAPFWIIFVTFIGLGDTLYLSYYHALGILPTCSLGGCEIVLSSPYATPFGIIALSYVGLMYYLYMLALGVVLAYDPYGKGTRFAMLAYAGIGLAFSIFFELFQYFVIHALCEFCALSAATTLVLFILALWHWRSSRTKVGY